MEIVKIFDTTFKQLAKAEPKLLEYVHNESVKSLKVEDKRCEQDGEKEEFSADKTSCKCSFCKVQFSDVETQRNHYKLDWHRYNLQRNLNGQPPITEHEFEEKEDVSSISGSDSESESIAENKSYTYIDQNKTRVYISTNKKSVFLIHRCLLADKKSDLLDLSEPLELLENPQWAIIMIGGGHFAAAIFNGTTPVLHKTFHFYTVRAGQGGTQSSRDNKNGSAPKSAGASIRRYNEQMLAQQIQALLESWKPELDMCALIPFRAPGPFNQNILFGGKRPVLSKTDGRLRVIPIPTRRPTMKEVQRVHEVLSTVKVYESMGHIPKDAIIPDERYERKRTQKKKAISCARSCEPIKHPLPDALFEGEEDAKPESKSLSLKNEAGKSLSSSDSSSDGETTYNMESLLVSFKDSLESFGDTVTTVSRLRKTKQHQLTEKTRQHLANQAQIKEEKARAKTDNKLKLLLMQNIISNNQDAFEEMIHAQPDILNMRLNSTLDTPLHFCAFNKRGTFVSILLALGADVCMKNAENQTPYTCTQDKAIREIMKQFAQENPDMFNYAKAQIPVRAQMTPEEVEEKKQRIKEQKKAKRDRLKETKKLQKKDREEMEARERFVNLSDREKRALAAERRLLDSNGTVIARCFFCGNDISGMIPYEYSSNRFCTIDCLKAHRMKNDGLCK